MSSTSNNTNETKDQNNESNQNEELDSVFEPADPDAYPKETQSEKSGENSQEAQEPTENQENEESREEQDPIQALQDEIKELKETRLRERADFINFRKRSTAEREAAQTRATEDILQKLIPSLDSFDQLLTVNTEEAGSATKQVVEGASLIRKMMWQVFTDLGVSELDPVGGEFNPTQMEALSVSESAEVTEERVEQVYQKAYIINNKVIRPARVAVVKPAPPAENASSQEAEKQEAEE